MEYDEGSDYKGRETTTSSLGQWCRCWDGGDDFEAYQRSNGKGTWLRLWTTTDFGKG